jgi:hypothetical protein
MIKFDVDILVKESGSSGKREYKYDQDLAGEMTLSELLEFTKSSLIVIADQALREEKDKGFPSDFITLVDGSRTKPVSQVNPLGRIEFVAKIDLTEVIRYIYSTLTRLSPVDTGQYKNSNYVFLNGVQVATDPSSLEAWLATSPVIKVKDKIRFVNIQPYARRLERLGIRAGENGNIGRRRTRTRVQRNGDRKEYLNQPNGAYFTTARAAVSKYKRNSKIMFTFITGGELGIAGSFKTGRPGRNSSGRPYLYPTIVLTIGEGVK